MIIAPHEPALKDKLEALVYHIKLLDHLRKAPNADGMTIDTLRVNRQ